MKILVLGAQGQLGRCLIDQFKDTQHEVIFCAKAEVDITDFLHTKNIISKLRPDVVINSAAYSAVDDAESEPENATLINQRAVFNISEVCRKVGSWLIHISTDYVFDGNSSVPYTEQDHTSPLNRYGLSKLGGELAIKKSGCKYIIIRTAWLFSEYGQNFMKKIFDDVRTRTEMRVVSDQVGCPTYAQDLASEIVKSVLGSALSVSRVGLYHYCGHQPCSRYEFAKRVSIEAAEFGFESSRNLLPVLTSDLITAAARPGYSVLNCGKFISTFGKPLSDWRLGLTCALRKITN